MFLSKKKLELSTYKKCFSEISGIQESKIVNINSIDDVIDRVNEYYSEKEKSGLLTEKKNIILKINSLREDTILNMTSILLAIVLALIPLSVGAVINFQTQDALTNYQKALSLDEQADNYRIELRLIEFKLNNAELGKFEKSELENKHRLYIEKEEELKKRAESSNDNFNKLMKNTNSTNKFLGEISILLILFCGGFVYTVSERRNIKNCYKKAFYSLCLEEIENQREILITEDTNQSNKDKMNSSLNLSISLLPVLSMVNGAYRTGKFIKKLFNNKRKK